MGVPVQDILFTVFQSIFEVFLLCLAGFTLSAKGIVDKPTSKVINNINISLFTPSLLFSKVAFFLTPAKLRQLWVIPIFFVIVTGLSAVIAHTLARLCRLKRSQVNFATAASMFMNSNSLPVAIMQSLALTGPILKWGPDDTIDAMFGRSLTYLAVFSTFGMVVGNFFITRRFSFNVTQLRWSYGIHLLSQPDEPAPIMPPKTTYQDMNDTDELTYISAHPSTTVPLTDYETETDIEPRDRRLWGACRARVHPRHHSNLQLRSHLPAVPASLGDQSGSDKNDLETTDGDGDSEDTIALSQVDIVFSTESEEHPPTPRWVRSSSSPFTRFLTTFMSLSPPLIASLFALCCALVSPLQRLLNSREMIPFKGALENAGACSIPLTLLVLGGWFWDGDSKAKFKHKENQPHAIPEGQSNAKSHWRGKGKGVEKRHAITSHMLHSRESSTATLSTTIGAFMSHKHPRRGSARTRWRMDESVVAYDIESGPQPMTHCESEIEHDENVGVEPPSQSPSLSRTDPVIRRTLPLSPPHTSMNPPGETLTVIVTLLARMILVPFVVAPMLILVSRFGWGGEVFEDPVFIVSCMLLISSPPALTLAQISQRSKTMTTDTTTTGGAGATKDAFERLLSRTVFWSYLVLTPPITIVSVMVGLLLVES